MSIYITFTSTCRPDLILRTSGEKRLSGFLIWQSAYSELVFMDVFGPEFRKIDLMRAIRNVPMQNKKISENKYLDRIWIEEAMNNRSL